MNPAEALRLDNTTRLAIVGAGGKTSAIFALAKALKQRKPLAGPVLLTTTTHLAVEQCARADTHFQIQYPDEVAQFARQLTAGVVLFTGTSINVGRISGPSTETLEAIFRLAEARGWPVLVEADGARLLPLKAPAEHEPPIPGWVNQVLVCAGLSGIDKSFGPETVHRPEIYAQLSGLADGDLISYQAITQVLNHPSGGLKNIPPSVRRMALLNQADTPELQAVARRMADNLLDAYEAVIISSLSPTQGEPAIHAVIETVAGIILAAGSASRFGQPKQLIHWQGETLVQRAARTALRAGLAPVLVVTGAYAQEVEQAVADLPVKCVFNPHWEAGQGTSVARGVLSLPDRTGAAVFLLADQPQVPMALISSLVESHSSTLMPITGPLIDGQRGNPVLFDRITFKDLSQLQGDIGGRAIFSRYPVQWLPWHDASASLDIDTPADLERL